MTLGKPESPKIGIGQSAKFVGLSVLEHDDESRETEGHGKDSQQRLCRAHGGATTVVLCRRRGNFSFPHGLRKICGEDKAK